MLKRKSGWDDPKQTKRAKSGPHENSELVHDSIVDCVICGAKMQLNHLVEHQKTIHMQFQPNSDVIRCVHCQYPMAAASIERHMRRKHPNKFQKMSSFLKSKNLQNLCNFTTVTVPNRAPNRQPESGDHKKKEERKEKPGQRTSAAYAPIAEISTAQDEDGFSQLIITEF